MNKAELVSELTNTNNRLSSLVDPQLWVNGTMEVGTQDLIKVTEIEEVVVTAQRKIQKLEPILAKDIIFPSKK